MNPLYSMMMGGTPLNAAPQIPPMAQQLMSRIGQTNAIMQALQNPAVFAKQQFPDIPDQIVNDSNQVLSYLQQTRGITNQQIQQVANMWPYVIGR